MIPEFHIVNTITESDIERLVDLAVPEGPNLDFKRAAYERPADFCRDISAMANSGGGCILLGVEEREGVAASICGLKDDLDKLQLRLSQAAEANIRPRLILRLKVVEVGGAKVLIFATSSSRSGPHMTVANGDRRIYKRAGSHNEVMDVSELRAAFLHSKSQEEIALSEHRVHCGIYADLQNQSGNECAIVLDFYPAPFGDEILNTADRAIHSIIGRARSVQNAEYRRRMVFDGYQIASRDSRSDCVTVRRDAVIRTRSLFSTRNHDQPQVIGGQWLLRELTNCVEAVRGVYRDLELSRPIHACLTMLGCFGWRLALSFNWEPLTFTKYVFEFPPLLFESDADSTDSKLKDWFDRIWNAANIPACPLYDPETGEADWKRLSGV